MSIRQQLCGKIRITTVLTTLCLCGAFFAGIIAIAPSVYADPTPASPAIVLNPSVTGGEFRNVVNASVSATGGPVQQITIEIKRTDGSSLSPRVVSEGAAGEVSTTLRWSTTTDSDGEYRIFYTAVDANGQIVQDSYPISINNSRPVISLSSTADGRTIGGTISLVAAAFTVKINDTVRDVQPTIAETPDWNGNYMWSMIVPSDVKEGQHDFDITATSFISGISANATGRLKISAPQTSTAGTDTKGGALTLPDPAKEVGQFIAPPMPSATRTQLFGVSTSDITGNQPETLTVAPPSGQPATLAVKKSALMVDSTPIAPSASGWLIFGVAWYWWFGIVVGAACAVYAAVQYAPIPFKRQQLVIGAKS